MNGLQLSEKYFFKIGQKMIKEKYNNYEDQIAAGLVGEGSECLKFDDDISQDHDWGPGFCLWLNQETFNIIGASLQSEYNKLPKNFEGYTNRNTNKWINQRVGVFEINAFYAQFTGLYRFPKSLLEWRRIPEEYLSAATNGKVFIDQAGLFSEIRKNLLDYYPEDVRLKKIASRCMIAGQSGQYNFFRCLRRKEYIAAHHALSLFIRNSISLIFLLNRRYMPYYKWMHRALNNLPILGQTLFPVFHNLAIEDFRKSRKIMCNKIEEISTSIIQEFKKQELSDLTSNFLCDHGPIVQSKINDPGLRNTHVMVE